MTRSKVAVLKTNSERVVDDYHRLLKLIDYRSVIDFDQQTLLKLNLSWTKYFPSCSSQPWQVEGVVKAMISDGCPKENLLPLENKTVVTNPIQGAKNNLWMPILDKYDVGFTPLPDV